MNRPKAKGSSIQGLQLHYTSCRHGLSGHAGFQTRAMSSDIRPEEQRAIERLGIYQAPRNCPVEPDKQQINEIFPIAYRNAYLETGKLAVARSVYVGKDYTGRWGNYFSHAVLIEQLPNNIWPVDLYEWKDWKNKLEGKEDTDQATLNLPKAIIVADEAAYSFTELQEFLREENGRYRQLAKMIQAVLLRSETSRSVVIREELKSNNLFWIACIQKSFPPKHQNELSCSSYQFDPRGCLAVNAIYGETDFSFGENERRFQFYVFDFVDDIHSDVDDVENEYAKVISSWMYECPEKLKSFHDFSNYFEHSTLNDELLLILRLFCISEDENLSLSDVDLINILDFVNSYTKNEYFETVHYVVASSINQLSKSNNPDYISHLVIFFVNSAKNATDNHDFRIVAYKQILRLVHNVIFDKSYSVEKLELLRSEARAACKSFDIDFSELFLSEQNLSEIYSKVELLDDQGWLIAMSEIISADRFMGYDDDELLKDSRLLGFIKSRLSSDVPDLTNVDWLFSPFDDTPYNSASICIYVCEVLYEWVETDKITQEEYDEALRTFALFLSRQFQLKGDEHRYNIINLVKNNSATWRLLEEEWKHSISDQGDKTSSQEIYYQNVLQQESEFSKRFRLEFSENVWKLLSPKEQYSQAIAWIEANHTACFHRQFLKTVIQKASEGISFKLEDPKSDVLIELIDTELRNANIELQPNRLMLRHSVLMASDSSTGFEEQSVLDAEKAISGIDQKAYKEFTASYLPQILAKSTKPEQHGTVLKSILMNQFYDSFLRSYKRFFDQGKPNQFNITEMAALSFWISLANQDEDYKKFKDIRMEAIDLLASRISGLNGNAYKTLVRINNSNKNLTPAQTRSLNAIYRKVEDKKNTFLRRVWRKSSESMRNFRNKIGR